MKEYQLRMYFFVPYNISDIQKGIQAGHAALEYANRYGETDLFKSFVANYKTWIILNGGTTNNDMVNMGTLQALYHSIHTFNMNHPDNMVEMSPFYEPDLNDAMTAFCFIADERVWDFINYPDLREEVVYDGTNNLEDIAEIHMNWEKMMGGEKNIFLRDLIRGVKLA